MTQSDADADARTLPSPAVFQVPATMGRRLGELGVAGLWGVLLALSLFPPSGEYGMTWFMAPLGALGVTHFLRRVFDSRPRLVVDGRGITDRTSLFGGRLHVPWEAVRRVSRSKLNGFVQLEVADLDAVRDGAGWGRRLQITLGRLVGIRRIEIRPTLLGVDGGRLASLIEERLEDFERRDLGLENGAADRIGQSSAEDAHRKSHSASQSSSP